MKILENLDALFQEKKLPLKKQELSNNQTLYQGMFQIRPGKQVPFGIVVVNGEEVVDFQIAYKNIAYLSNYNDKERVLELLNELNAGKTFYYNVILQNDGEIMMKAMAKTTEDVRPLYEMLVIGSSVLRYVVEQIEKTIGTGE